MTSFTPLTDKYLSSGRLQVPVQEYLQLELTLHGAGKVAEKLLGFVKEDTNLDYAPYVEQGLEHILQLCAQLRPDDAPNTDTPSLPPHGTYSQLQAINETLRERLRQLSGLEIESPETHGVFDHLHEVALKNQKLASELTKAREKISLLENQLFMSEILNEPQRTEKNPNLFPLSGYKDAVIEGLVINHIYTEEHQTNPEKALNDLIEWEVSIALDPRVSKEAQALLERGRNEGVKEYKLPITPEDIKASLQEAYGLGREYERSLSIHQGVSANIPARLTSLISNTISTIFGGSKQ